MKRKWMMGALGLVLAGLVLLLGRTAFQPEDFTGVWYREEDGMAYTFREGRVQCVDGMELEGEGFSGAYTFSRKEAALFLVDDKGVSDVVRLQLVRSPEGDTLCRGDAVWFRRNP